MSCQFGLQWITWCYSHGSTPEVVKLIFIQRRAPVLRQRQVEYAMVSRSLLSFHVSVYLRMQSIPQPTMRRLMREINDLKNNPPEGIRITTNDDNLLDVTGIIEGPGVCFYGAFILQ